MNDESGRKKQTNKQTNKLKTTPQKRNKEELLVPNSKDFTNPLAFFFSPSPLHSINTMCDYFFFRFLIFYLSFLYLLLYFIISDFLFTIIGSAFVTTPYLLPTTTTTMNEGGVEAHTYNQVVHRMLCRIPPLSKHELPHRRLYWDGTTTIIVIIIPYLRLVDSAAGVWPFFLFIGLQQQKMSAAGSPEIPAGEQTWGSRPGSGPGGGSPRRPHSTSAEVPTLRQLFYYSNRIGGSHSALSGRSGAPSPSASSAPSLGTEQTEGSEQHKKQHAQEHAGVSRGAPTMMDEPVTSAFSPQQRHKKEKKAAHSSYNPYNQPTPELEAEIKLREQQQQQQQPSRAGGEEAEEDNKREEDIINPVIAEQLHNFFQYNVVKPYTVREKTMNLSNLGWLPKDDLLASAGRHHRPELKKPNSNRLPLNLPTRAPRHQEWPPLYVAPDGRNRYRKIEDLALFVRTGAVTPETHYFRDPMQRRLHEEVIFLAPQQKVIQSEDPRQDRIWTDEGKKNRAQAKLQSIIPKKAQLCKLKHDHSTGLVKPYALGKSVHVASAKPFSEFAVESAMESYVTTMQCQRPTKGLRGPMIGEDGAQEERKRSTHPEGVYCRLPPNKEEEEDDETRPDASRIPKQQRTEMSVPEHGQEEGKQPQPQPQNKTKQNKTNKQTNKQTKKTAAGKEPTKDEYTQYRHNAIPHIRSIFLYGWQTRVALGRDNAFQGQQQALMFVTALPCLTLPSSHWAKNTTKTTRKQFTLLARQKKGGGGRPGYSILLDAVPGTPPAYAAARYLLHLSLSLHFSLYDSLSLFFFVSSPSYSLFLAQLRNRGSFRFTFFIFDLTPFLLEVLWPFFHFISFHFPSNSIPRLPPALAPSIFYIYPPHFELPFFVVVPSLHTRSVRSEGKPTPSSTTLSGGEDANKQTIKKEPHQQKQREREVNSFHRHKFYIFFLNLLFIIIIIIIYYSFTHFWYCIFAQKNNKNLCIDSEDYAVCDTTQLSGFEGSARQKLFGLCEKLTISDPSIFFFFDFFKAYTDLDWYRRPARSFSPQTDKIKRKVKKEYANNQLTTKAPRRSCQAQRNAREERSSKNLIYTRIIERASREFIIIFIILLYYYFLWFLPIFLSSTLFLRAESGTNGKDLSCSSAINICASALRTKKRKEKVLRPRSRIYNKHSRQHPIASSFLLYYPKVFIYIYIYIYILNTRKKGFLST
eukprot:gene8845-6226_t